MNLVEIFSSVQGEGLTLGERTLFVRFGECDLRCTWCDSAHTWRPAASCRIETSPGSGRFEERENPLSGDEVRAALEGLGIERHRWISFTGGEPLLQPDAVLELAGKLRGRGPGLHLETHGAAPEALERVVDAIDLVSMDWKLASDVRREKKEAGAPDFHGVHERFLSIARRAPRVFVKLVLTPNSTDAELAEAFDRIAAVDPQTPLVLQPVTPCGAIRQAPPPARLFEILARAEQCLGDVRLIPQAHPVLGIA